MECHKCRSEKVKALKKEFDAQQEFYEKLFHAHVEDLQKIAERQREACAKRLQHLLQTRGATAVWVDANDILKTPLVTEE